MMDQNGNPHPIAIGGTAILLALFAVVYASVLRFLVSAQILPLSSVGSSAVEFNQQQPDTVTAKATGSRYNKVSQKPDVGGWFTTGQEADLMLSGFGFNTTGGPLLFNHPGVLASDGTRLLVPDRFNNRVLVWNSLPVGNIPPDFVLGQKDFTTNDPGTGGDQMNWPVSVSVSTDGKVAVADTMNDRILLWLTFPTQNGQPADIVVSGRQAPGQQKPSIIWPWGVWTDGQKLVVTSTRGRAALIWNTFPTRSDQQPDLFLTANAKFGTPRTITSDGTRLLVSDHNAALERPSVTFVWNTFPTANDHPYDFVLPGWQQGTIAPTGHLVLLGEKLNVWNTFPTSQDDLPDLVVGRTAPMGAGFQFEGGDGAGVIEAGGKLYISLYNGNKVVGYHALPTGENQEPDFVIGAPDTSTNTLKTNYLISNPQVATDGKSLFIVSDFDRKLYVWKDLPDESGAKPDYVYDFFGKTGNVNFQASGIAVWGNTLAIVGRGAGDRPDVYLWRKLPRNGELPDRHFTGRIGSVQLQKPSGVAIDKNYFYLSDELAGKIYVWKGTPKETAEPAFVLSIENPTAISSDGNRLLVNTMRRGQNVAVFDIASLSSAAKPQYVMGMAAASGIAYLTGGHLFAANTGNSQVRAWNSVDDALSGRDADVLLGDDDFGDEVAQIGKNKLFWPNSLAFDGKFLWVGEVKFSNRLVRFSVR